MQDKYGVTHRLSTAYPPTNKVGKWKYHTWLKSILERSIGENRLPGSDKLDDALWASAQLTNTHRCTLKACVWKRHAIFPTLCLRTKLLAYKAAKTSMPVITGDQRSSNQSGYQQKDRKPSQNDKTEHGMEKTVQNQGQSPKMPKSESILKNQQSNRSRN
ncbi:hypothetical protein Tco_1309774 [Tanacetum coccineum]